MNFKPRASEPSKTNKWFIPVDVGGFNPCLPIGDGKSCLPNCVGYAWGRASEICGVRLALPTDNAEDWYYSAKDKFNRGSTPKLGAIICWKKGKNYNGSDGFGHVAVVEKIYKDGTIITSNSDYFGKRFFLQKLKKPYTLKGYDFLGFIYLPLTFNKYTTGNYIVTTDVLNVRKKPTTSSDKVLFKDLTENAQEQVTKLCGYSCNGYCKGVEFTVSEIHNNWGKTPSGWVCLDYCEKI